VAATYGDKDAPRAGLGPRAFAIALALAIGAMAGVFRATGSLAAEFAVGVAAAVVLRLVGFPSSPHGGLGAEVIAWIATFLSAIVVGVALAVSGLDVEASALGGLIAGLMAGFYVEGRRRQR
jgi:hypothetical protein